MDVVSSSKVALSISKKRFLFDKRYGYVYDDWREPSEVALAYGRGMFCIVPLGKALFTMVSKSLCEPGVSLEAVSLSSRIEVNLAASRTIEVLEKPEQLSSRSLQQVNNLNNQLHQVMFSMKNMQSNLFKVNEISYQRP